MKVHLSNDEMFNACGSHRKGARSRYTHEVTCGSCERSAEYKLRQEKEMTLVGEMMKRREATALAEAESLDDVNTCSAARPSRAQIASMLLNKDPGQFCESIEQMCIGFAACTHGLELSLENLQEAINAEIEKKSQEFHEWHKKAIADANLVHSARTSREGLTADLANIIKMLKR